jgi:hypothetical protein
VPDLPPDTPPSHDTVVLRIRQSGLTVYDLLVDRPELYLSIEQLQALLREHLLGQHLPGAIRTRNKVAKQLVVDGLGYPQPKSFKRVRPRFLGQHFDLFIQKSTNLQIWNDDIEDPTRRYVIVGVNADDVVTAVRVLDGETLARLDTTGTLTQKYQASRLSSSTGSKLVSDEDTAPFRAALAPVETLPPAERALLNPLAHPARGKMLSIRALHEELLAGLVGQRIPRAELQERRQGEALQKLVTTALGLPRYGDNGQFPDLPCQALEVKAQWRGTIDLGLVTPASTEPAPTLGGLRHCDARYLVTYLEPVGDEFEITHIVMSTGEAFFTEFRRFEGNIQNKKIQIHLPADFFTA